MTDVATSGAGAPLEVQILRRSPTLARGTKVVEFSGALAKLFTALVAHQGAPVPYDRLKRLVWGTADVDDSRLYFAARRVRAAAGTLRLERAVDCVRGVGYRFVAPATTVDLDVMAAEVRRAEADLRRNDFAAVLKDAYQAERRWAAYPAIDLPGARELIRNAFGLQLRAGIMREGLVDERAAWRRAQGILTSEDRERVADEVLFACLTRAEELLNVGLVKAFSARALLVSLLKSFPASVEARSLLNQTDVLIYNKDLKCPRPIEDVEADARDVLDVRPDCLSARLTMTHILFERGRGEQELRQAYETITAARPTGARARRVVARALVDTGQSDTAIGLLGDGDFERMDYRNLELLTYAHLHRGEYERAVYAAECYIASRRGIDGNIGWGMALALIHQGRHDKAKSVLLNALEQEPSNVSLWVQLANAFTTGDGKVKGRQVALHALATLGTSFDAERSSNPRAVAWLVELQAQAGMGDSVARLATRLRVESPNNGYLAYRVGLAYGRLGRVEPALAMLHEAARLGFCSVEQLRQEVMCIPDLAGAGGLTQVIARMNDEVDRLRKMFAFGAIPARRGFVHAT